MKQQVSETDIYELELLPTNDILCQSIIMSLPCENNFFLMYVVYSDVIEPNAHC